MIMTDAPIQQPAQVTENAAEALKHFATAFAFLLAGLIALFLNSELLASGGARSLRVVTGLHFLTLGWLTLSIFGALQVFTGVALGGVKLSNRLAPWGRRLWSLGLVFFVVGLLVENTPLLASGFGLLGLALVLYSTQVFPALLQARRGQITKAFIVIAFFSLWSAWLLGTTAGLARAGWGFALEILPPGYLQAHILLAVFGWVGSMIIGVGSHLVPMFALSRDTTQLPLKITLGVWTALPVAGILSAYFPNPWITISWSIAALGSLTWAVQFVLYLRGRIRREKDYGLMIAALATTFLILAWIGAGLLKDPVPFIALALVGWLSFFTLGIYHRVLPFLVWFMKYSRPIKGLRPPKVKDLMDPLISLMVGAFVGLGILVWFGGLWLHETRAVYCGSGLILTGVLLALGHLETLRGRTAPSQRLIKSLQTRFSFLKNEKMEDSHGTLKRDASAKP